MPWSGFPAAVRRRPEGSNEVNGPFLSGEKRPIDLIHLSGFPPAAPIWAITYHSPGPGRWVRHRSIVVSGRLLAAVRFRQRIMLCRTTERYLLSAEIHLFPLKVGERSRKNAAGCLTIRGIVTDNGRKHDELFRRRACRSRLPLIGGDVYCRRRPCGRHQARRILREAKEIHRP